MPNNYMNYHAALGSWTWRYDLLVHLFGEQGGGEHRPILQTAAQKISETDGNGEKSNFFRISLVTTLAYQVKSIIFSDGVVPHRRTWY